MTDQRDHDIEVDHYGSQYGNFRSEVLAAVRRQAFGDDYGQNGWQTADEHDHFIDCMKLDSGSVLLDVACGSGGRSRRNGRRATSERTCCVSWS